jgi:hypothetical protein
VCFELFINVFEKSGELKLRTENKYFDKHSHCLFLIVYLGFVKYTQNGMGEVTHVFFFFFSWRYV